MSKKTDKIDEAVEEAKELIVAPPTSLTGDPKEIVKEASKAAKVLMDIVSKNKWAVQIQGKKYLQFEAWQTLGKFYGYTVRVEEAKHVEFGNIAGFEARAVVLDGQGREIGGAESICMNDEPTWKNRPLYALKSMAQTRASAKALRHILAWVAVLAGYAATPAEEVPPEGFNNAQPADPEKLRKMYWAKFFNLKSAKEAEELLKDLVNAKIPEGDKAAIKGKVEAKRQQLMEDELQTLSPA